jgi:hypothetical protein
MLNLMFNSLACVLSAHPNMPAICVQVRFATNVFCATPKAHNIQQKYNTMKVSMYSGSATDFPSLKGKAAEIRHFAVPLLDTVRELLDDSLLEHRHIKMMVQMAVAMETILDTHADEYKWPENVADDYSKAVCVFVQPNSALRVSILELELVLFNFTAKYHYALHVALLAKHMNPRLNWCFAGEDLMQIVKSIVAACTRGVAGPMVSHKALVKYAFGLGLKFTGRF